MIFYDFEVFRYDWLVVFKDVIRKKETVIINNRDKLIKFYEDRKDDIFIGYNSNHYDQYIFKGLLLGMDIYKLNKWIISGNPGYKYSYSFNDIQLYDYDCSITFKSLKQLEGFMGNDIVESNISFNINRKLTDAELQDTVNYCKADVNNTMEVFLQTRSEFTSHLDLLKEFNLPLKHISKTKQQITAMILGAYKRDYDDEFDFEITDKLDIGRYEAIKGWYSDYNNRDYSKSLEIDVKGVPHVFRWGGLHGAINNYIDDGIFILADVSSYYPSLMIKYNYGSRSISKRGLYSKIYDQRFKLKAAKHPKEGIYKLVLNGAYGCMKYKYNGLYDPRQANNVCVNGQLLLVDLIDKLDDYKLIQSNTDGVMFKLDSVDQIDEFKYKCKEWEDRTGLGLSFELYDRIIQKDVNNYLAINYKYRELDNLDDPHNYIGKNPYIVGKGAWLKNLSKLDYDLPVVNKALKAYFIDGIRPEEYINNENRLIEFQQIVKISKNYDYAMHKNKIYRNQKVFRVFASTYPFDTGIFKVKAGGRPEKFEGTSPYSFIYNENVKGVRVPDKLDKDYYINIAWNRINDIIGRQQ